MNKIAIIVLNYNQPQLTIECLESIEASTYENYSVILVDNCSTDNSTILLQQYIFSKKNDTCFIQSPVNKGFGGGVNLGIQKCLKDDNVDYIFLLNNDAVIDKDIFYPLIKTIESGAAIGIVAAKVLQQQQQNGNYIIDTTGDFVTTSGRPVPRGRGLEDKGQYETTERIFSACAAAALYKKKVFEIAGLFEERYFMYFEDVDLSFRANLAGFLVYYQPDAICYHRLSASTAGKKNLFVTSLGFRNIFYLYLINFPFALIVKYFILFTVGRFFTLINLIKHGNIAYPFKALLGLPLDIPYLIKKHSEVSRMRKLSVKEIDKLLLPSSLLFSKKGQSKFDFKGFTKQ